MIADDTYRYWPNLYTLLYLTRILIICSRYDCINVLTEHYDERHFHGLNFRFRYDAPGTGPSDVVLFGLYNRCYIDHRRYSQQQYSIVFSHHKNNVNVHNNYF